MGPGAWFRHVARTIVAGPLWAGGHKFGVVILGTIQRQAESNTKLARYAAIIEQLSISRERNRLAREPHDMLAHLLRALSGQLEAVRLCGMLTHRRHAKCWPRPMKLLAPA